MRAVALRLDGPLQSYGGSVVGNHRATLDAPTTSAVLGLVGAALGYFRHDVAALAALHAAYALAVRVDRPGEVMVDYHTAEGVPSDGRGGTAETQLTRRHYLTDASFAVALVARNKPPVGASPEDIAAALRHPRFALALGRRACVPGVPVLDPRRTVIEGETWRALLAQVPSAPALSPWGARDDEDARVWVDAALCGDELGEHAVRIRDRLVGPLPRMFLEREVRRFRVARPEVDPALCHLLGLSPPVASSDAPTDDGGLIPETDDTTGEFFG